MIPVRFVLIMIATAGLTSLNLFHEVSNPCPACNATILRFSQLSRADADALITRGEPFVLTHGASAWVNKLSLATITALYHNADIGSLDDIFGSLASASHEQSTNSLCTFVGHPGPLSPEERATVLTQLTDASGSWYWWFVVNHASAQRSLAAYFGLPPVLDRTRAENNLWIFLGKHDSDESLPLCGVAPHIDEVRASASFHLQLSGLKRWQLAHPPESKCAERCPPIEEFDIAEGDLFVFKNDYFQHSTQIPPQPTLMLSVEQQYN
jgi:hypothetical protein